MDQLTKMNTDNLCYYCRANNAVPQYVHVQKLYKDVNSKVGLGLIGLNRTTTYYQREFEILRCETCFKDHERYKNRSMYISGSVFLVTALASFIFFFPSFITSMLAGALAGSFVYFIMSVFFRKRKVRTLGIKDEEDVKEHPAIKQAISEG